MKMRKKIYIKDLGISISLKNKRKYFELIEKLQKEVTQDTYLLMDNLYEESASCIDTYSLFLYLKQNGYKAKYILYKKNSLYQELKEKGELEDIIVADESSLTGHDLYEKIFFTLIVTKYIILSFPESLYEDIRIFAYKNRSIQVLMIGHGPVFFKTSLLDFKKTNYLAPERFNLYLVSSLKEKNLLVRAGWPADRIFNIGLPRFDWCKKKKHAEKNIVIMFTWRLDSFRKLSNAKDLKYFEKFDSLLNNKTLQDIAKTNGYKVTIALHHSIKDLCSIDIKVPKCFEIADTNNLIEYINTADLFITDYSSIVHDFMFLNTPVIFYRLDYGDPLLCEFDKYDLEECKEKDSQIFNVFYEEKDLIGKIEYYINNNFTLEPEYKEIEDSFFTEKKDICKKLVEQLECYTPTNFENIVVEPNWKDVKTAICVSSSDEYLPYLCVYLKSITKYTVAKKDVIVFNRCISEANKEKLLKCFSDDDSFSIRFIDPSPLFRDINLYVSHDYFKEECYYRIAAPKLLNKYDKIVFTDLDLIVQDDILKLADINLEGHPIAACIEPLWRELYMDNNKIEGRRIRAYSNDVLKLSNPFNYYNTGVVVFDVKEYNRLNSFDIICDIVNQNQLLYQEQCALNILFNNNFYTLPNVWNYELAPSLINNKYNFDFYNEYKSQEKNAKILHYLGRYKPWKNQLEYKADIWWEYARRTPFYEEIFAQLLDAKISQNKKEIRLRCVAHHMAKFMFKKALYRIMKTFYFGKKNKEYQLKYDKVKTLIREAKHYKKIFKF